MNFTGALILWLILFLLLLWGTTRNGVDIFSSLVFSALISAIVLMFLIPPAELNHHYNVYLEDKPHRCVDTYVFFIYSIIMLVTLILVTAYVIYKTFQDIIYC